MAKKMFHLSILSPEKKIFDGDVGRVILPGTEGSFAILPRHAPIVSSLKEGTIVYKTMEGEQSIDIQKGFVEKSDENVSVCITIK